MSSLGNFNGDVSGLMRLIFLEKNDITFGVLIGLLLLVVVLMLVRSVVEEKSGGHGGGAEIDAKSLGVAVEGAVKKALSEKTVVTTVEKPAAEATATADSASGDSGELKQILNEREAKIAALMSDLEAMKAAVEAKPKEAKGPAVGGPDLLALHTKVNELQAKLSEYEIIEDDIADLSSFKEENKKLKEEVEKLRAATETAQTQVQAAQVSVAAAASPAPTVDPVAAAQAAVVSAETSAASVDEFAAALASGGASEAPVADVAAPVAAAEPAPAARPPAEPFKLDTSDDVMGEFAQALSGEASVEAAPSDALVVSSLGGAVEDPQAAIDALLAEAATEVTTASAASASAKAAASGATDSAATAPDSSATPEGSATPEARASGVSAGSSSETDLFAATIAQTSPSTATPAPAPDAASTQASASATSAESDESAASDPFGELDTEKMLEEVAALKEDATDSPSVLDDQLDTDRLMAEMGMMDAPAAAPAAKAASPVQDEITDDATAEFAAAVASAKAPPVLEAAVTSMSPPPKAGPAVVEIDPSEAPVDDLLAEFKDTDFQAKGAKGS